MNTFPVLLGALCIYAIAYRYYSAFIAAKALALDDRRVTPAHAYKRSSESTEPHGQGTSRFGAISYCPGA